MDETKRTGGGSNGFDGVHGARVVEVIEVRANRGTGTVDDPVRAVCRYYSKDGDKLAEDDQIGLRALRDRVVLAERARDEARKELEEEAVRLVEGRDGRIVALQKTIADLEREIAALRSIVASRKPRKRRR